MRYRFAARIRNTDDSEFAEDIRGDLDRTVNEYEPYFRDYSVLNDLVSLLYRQIVTTAYISNNSYYTDSSLLFDILNDLDNLSEYTSDLLGVLDPNYSSDSDG